MNLPFNTLNKDSYPYLDDSYIDKYVPVLYGQIAAVELTCINSNFATDSSSSDAVYRMPDGMSDYGTAYVKVDDVWKSATVESAEYDTGLLTVSNGRSDSGSTYTCKIVDCTGYMFDSHCYPRQAMQHWYSTYGGIEYTDSNFSKTEWESELDDSRYQADFGLLLDDYSESEDSKDSYGLDYFNKVIFNISTNAGKMYARVDYTADGKITARLLDLDRTASDTIQSSELFNSGEIAGTTSGDTAYTKIIEKYYYNANDDTYLSLEDNTYEKTVKQAYKIMQSKTDESYLVYQADALVRASNLALMFKFIPIEFTVKVMGRYTARLYDVYTIALLPDNLTANTRQYAGNHDCLVTGVAPDVKNGYTTLKVQIIPDRTASTQQVAIRTSAYTTITREKTATEIVTDDLQTSIDNNLLLTGYLTVPSLSVVADKDGNVTDYSDATGTFTVKYSGTDVTGDGPVYSVVSQTGCTGEIDETTGVYAITALSADVGILTLQATYEGLSFETSFTVTKSYAGQTGTPGTTIEVSSPDSTTPETNMVYDNSYYGMYGGQWYMWKWAQELLFNGSSTYVSADNPFTENGAEWRIEGEFNTDNISNDYQTICGSRTSYPYGICIRLYQGYISIDAGGSRYTTSYLCSADTDYTFAVTGDASGLSLYINGTLEYSNTISAVSSNFSSAFTIGVNNNNETLFFDYFSGVIKNIRIYDSLDTSSLTNKWLLTEGSGTIANDTAGSIDGTIYNGTWQGDDAGDTGYWTLTSATVPTDAVLHYSFDDMPDLPDASGDLSGQTVANISNFAITEAGGIYTCVASVSNPYLRISKTGVGITSSFILCYDVFISELNGNTPTEYGYIFYTDSTYSYLNTQLVTPSADKWQTCKILVNPTPGKTVNYIRLDLISGTITDTATVKLKNIYAGYGATKQPIIDNVSGKYNATASGLVSAQGMSGKCAHFLEKQASQFDLSDYANAQSWWHSRWIYIDYTNTTVNPRFWQYGNKDYCYTDDGSSSGTGNVNITSYNGSTTILCGIPRTSLVGGWHHLVVQTTIDSSTSATKKVYLDGYLYRTATSSADFTDLTFTSSSFNGGSSLTGNVMNGMQDDFHFGVGEISASDVLGLYLARGNTAKYYLPSNAPAYRGVGELISPLTKIFTGASVDDSGTITEGSRVTDIVYGDWFLGYTESTSTASVYYWSGTTWTATTEQKYVSAAAYDILNLTTGGYSIDSYTIIQNAIIKNLMVSQLKVLTNGVIYGGDRFDADGTEIDTSAKGFWMSSDGTLKAVLQSLNYETFLAGTDAGKNIPNNSACNWNTFTGTEAGKGSGAGGFPSQNAGYGYQSLFGINAGLNNSGFGPRSLYKLYNGDRNSGFGVTSLYNLYNGDSNSGFGVNSLVDCTGGSGNTAFGDSSAADITTGNYNACFGTGTHCYSTTLDYQININNTKKYIEFASTATQNTVYDAIVSLTNVSSGYISCSGYFGSNIFNTGIITSSTLSLYMGVSGAVGTFTNDSSTAIGSSLQIEVMTKRTPTNS